MSIKDLFSNRRGEVASLILIVSMIVATLGVITGSQIVEQQIKTATRAAEPSPALLAQVGGTCDSQCQNVGYDFGNCSPGTSCSATNTAHPSYACLAGRSACCCGYYPPTNTPIPPTATNTPVPKIFVVNGTVKYANGQGAEGISIKLLKYNASYQRTQTAQTTTDANGNYQFTNVIEGTYDVEPQPTSTTPINPTMQTISLITSPFTISVPNFTAGGNPPLTNTPIPPTATNTPAVPNISCTSLTGSLSGSILNLNVSVTNGLNPFYYQIKKGATTVAQGASTSATSASIAVANPTEGLYKAYVLNTQNGFYRSSTACEYTYTNTTATPIPPTSTPTSTAPPTVLRPDILIQSATTSFNTAGGMTLTTVFKNIGNADVNYVGAHAMKVEVALDNSSPNCSVTNLVGLAGLAPGATKTHTTYFPTNIYSGCPNFTPQGGTTYLLTLTADPTDIIRELNENNNIKSLSFTQPTPLIPTIPPTATPTSINPPPATNTPKATKTPTKTPTPSPTLPPDVTATPTNTPTSTPTPTATPLPGTTVDVKMNITIINPQTNYNVWGTAQELVTSGSAPAAIKCNLGDSAQALTVIKCLQLKRGKTYEFTAIAKSKTPGSQAIRSDKNSYLIPVNPDTNPRAQNKTITLPVVTIQPTQPPTATPTGGPSKPDLVIEKLEVSYVGPNSPTVKVSIKNAGSAKVNYNPNTTLHRIKAEIFDGTTSVCNNLNTVDIPNLGIGATVSNPISVPIEILPDCPTFTPTAGKTYSITFTLDATNVINETDETNNSKSVDINYGGNATATPIPVNKPDLIIQTATPTFNAANELTLTTVIKNKGTIAANATSVVGLKTEVFYNNKKVCNAVSSMNLQIEPGATITHQSLFASQVYVFCTLFNPIPGTTYTITLTVNPPIIGFPNGQVDESDITNNTLSVDFIQPGGNPTTPTMTPTDTPMPGTPTPTPLRAICQDILVNGDSAQKYDVIFIPSGYTDYNEFDADAREAMQYYKNAVPSTDLQNKYNYKVFTNLDKGYDVTTCQSTNNNLKYPCWSSIRAKETMRNCNGDAYVIIHYTPKPSEDQTKASEALAKFGNVKAMTLGKNRGEMLVLRYDLSELTKIVSGSIIGDGNPPSLLMQLLDKVLQRFR